MPSVVFISRRPVSRASRLELRLQQVVHDDERVIQVVQEVADTGSARNAA